MCVLYWNVLTAATTEKDVYTLSNTQQVLIFYGERVIPSLCLCAGETKNFENAFEVSNIKLTGLPLAFYSGMYAYAGW